MLNYTAFKEEFVQVQGNYPTLTMVERDEILAIEGSIEITNAGLIVDTYTIRIQPTESYPDRFPLLFETGGKIPINIDWHVYETDGHCCICTLPEEIIKTTSGISIEQFIENEVKPYLYNQTHRRLRGYYIQERKHGYAGEFQYYFDIFHTNDLQAILNHLFYIKKGIEPIRTANCFCGSGKKYRHCHREAFKAFSKLSEDDILLLVVRILKSPQFSVQYPELAKEYSKLIDS